MHPFEPHKQPNQLPATDEQSPPELELPRAVTPTPAGNPYDPHHYSTTPPVSSGPISGSVDQPIKTPAEIKQQLLSTIRNEGKDSPIHKWRPMITALAAGLIFLFVSYNEIAIAQIRQYVSPGSTLTTPIIIDPSSESTIGSEPKILIPKINVDVPVVYDITSYDEDEIQAGLERGVVHYGTTALPGEIGNNVIVGHSSNNFFNSGAYKFAFVLLDRLEKDDTFILHYKGERYVYRVFNKKVIEPSDFSVVQPTDEPITTLITCTPPGTSWRRLVIQGVQISPNPNEAKTSTESVPEVIETPIPGNAPSFWDRLF